MAAAIMRQLEAAARFLASQSALLEPAQLAASRQSFCNSIVAQINVLPGITLDEATSINTVIASVENFENEQKAAMGTAVHMKLESHTRTAPTNKSFTQEFFHFPSYAIASDWAAIESAGSLRQACFPVMERVASVGCHSPSEKSYAHLAGVIAAMLEPTITQARLFHLVELLKQAKSTHRVNAITSTWSSFPPSVDALPAEVRAAAYGSAVVEPRELPGLAQLVAKCPLRKSHASIRGGDAASTRGAPASAAANMSASESANFGAMLTALYQNFVAQGNRSNAGIHLTFPGAQPGGNLQPPPAGAPAGGLHLPQHLAPGGSLRLPPAVAPAIPAPSLVTALAPPPPVGLLALNGEAAVPAMPSAVPGMPAAAPAMPSAVPDMPAPVPAMPAAVPYMPAAVTYMPAAVPELPADVANKPAAVADMSSALVVHPGLGASVVEAQPTGEDAVAALESMGSKATGGGIMKKPAAPIVMKKPAAPGVMKKHAKFMLGCSRCRGSPVGCLQCREPKYAGRRFQR